MWCSYQLLELSFWRHPFTAEDPLLSKWCNATFLQIYSNEEKKSTTWMSWEWVHFHCGINYWQVFRKAALSTTVALNTFSYLLTLTEYKYSYFDERLWRQPCFPCNNMHLWIVHDTTQDVKCDFMLTLKWSMVLALLRCKLDIFQMPSFTVKVAIIHNSNKS